LTICIFTKKQIYPDFSFLWILGIRDILKQHIHNCGAKYVPNGRQKHYDAVKTFEMTITEGIIGKNREKTLQL